MLVHDTGTTPGEQVGAVGQLLPPGRQARDGGRGRGGRGDRGRDRCGGDSGRDRAVATVVVAGAAATVVGTAATVVADTDASGVVK